MEDAVRPTKEAFRAMYERGFQTWSSLYDMIFADTEANVSWKDSVLQLDNPLFCHPSFPQNLALDKSCSNTILAKGTTTWRTAQPPCELPCFEQNWLFRVASDRPVVLEISEIRPSAFDFSRWRQEDDHIAVLVLAWAYVLSARWAEIIPGICGPEYNTSDLQWAESSSVRAPTGPDTVIVDLGDVEDDAARWWAAILASDGGWTSTISTDKGHILHSPWYTKVVSKEAFQISRSSKASPTPASRSAPTFATALGHLMSYCQYHNVMEQMEAALAATLLLPVAEFENRRVYLPIPRMLRKVPRGTQPVSKTPTWLQNSKQLDSPLTLSCNALGTKALLNSVFFDPSVESNICGAWLQGTFELLDSDPLRDQDVLLRILSKRDPSLAFLWLGAFITGAHRKALQEARLGWWKIDLNTAAWTGTLMSFVQEPVGEYDRGTEQISRADECRLLYLIHEREHANPPLFSFAPFGNTAIQDTILEIRGHISCEVADCLEMQSLKWHCNDSPPSVLVLKKSPLRPKNGLPTSKSIPITYSNLDDEDDDCSEMVTRNIFTWLREQDGFPVAERAIREHEWIENLEDDDGEPITGDVRSTVGGGLHGWLGKTVTWRSNSI